MSEPYRSIFHRFNEPPPCGSVVHVIVIGLDGYADTDRTPVTIMRAELWQRKRPHKDFWYIEARLDTGPHKGAIVYPRLVDLIPVNA